MDFRTEIKISPFQHKLSLHSQILSVGSCFADVMGGRLQANKFTVLINPFGIIYNPISVLKLIASALEGSDLSENLLWQNQGLWYHYDLHSQIFAQSPEALINQSTSLITETGKFLKNADILLLTLGTAFTYQLKEHNTVVANCHKAPAQLFTKQLLSVAEVTNSLITLYSKLIALRPQLQIILTVSPVRHTKDGIPENQVSKSILRVACHEACGQCANLTYFPAYEIMLDDLRDYRFYKKDMIHPSEVAEEYIWTKFTESYLNEEAKEFLKEWEGVQKALAHKPFHAQSTAHQAFLQKTRNKLLKLSTQINVTAELQQIEKELRIHE